MHRIARMRSLASWPALVVLAGLSAGCSGDGWGLVRVQGQLTAEGKPLAGALVRFLPPADAQAFGAVGWTDENGRFTLLGTRRGSRGCLPGDYRVMVSRFVGLDGQPAAPDSAAALEQAGWESIPKPYSSDKDTPLTVTVPKWGGSLTVDLPVAPLTTKP